MAEDLVPWSTPGVMRASVMGSRPFNGSSAMVRLFITSDTLASSVLIAAIVASTATVCVNAPTGSVKFVRTVWLISTMMPVVVIFWNPGDSAVTLYVPTLTNSSE